MIILTFLPAVLSIAFLCYLWFIQDNPKHQSKIIDKAGDDKTRQFYRKIFSSRFFLAAALFTLIVVVGSLFNWYRSFQEVPVLIVIIYQISRLAVWVIIIYTIVKLFKKNSKG